MSENKKFQAGHIYEIYLPLSNSETKPGIKKAAPLPKAPIKTNPGEYYIQKGIPTIREYAANNPDQLSSNKLYSIYERDGADELGKKTLFYRYAPLPPVEPEKPLTGQVNSNPEFAGLSEDVKSLKATVTTLNQQPATDKMDKWVHEALMKAAQDSFDNQMKEMRTIIESVRAGEDSQASVAWGMLDDEKTAHNQTRQDFEQYRRESLKYQDGLYDEIRSLENANAACKLAHMEAINKKVEELEGDHADEMDKAVAENKGLADKLKEMETPKGLSGLIGNPAYEPIITGLAALAMEELSEWRRKKRGFNPGAQGLTPGGAMTQEQFNAMMNAQNAGENQTPGVS